MHRIYGKYTCLIVLAFFSIFVSGCIQDDRNIPINASNEIVVGALLPLTGELSFSGQAARAVLDVAAEDIESNLPYLEPGMKIRLIMEDTESDPSVALDKIKKLKEKGIIFVIGTDSSRELEAVKPFADMNDIILISHGSTAPSLSIAGDNVFRMLPDDTHQAEALAVQMREDGIEAVVPVWRGDVWGDDLSSAIKTRFEGYGGTVLNGVRYDPETDFYSELDALNEKVSQAVSKYGSDKVAVHFIGFNEVTTLFSRAGNNSISDVKWYGSDGTALNNGLLNNKEAARIAARTDFLNPFYSIEIKETEERIKAREGTAHAFGIAAYDALWLVTLTYIDANGSSDINVLKSTLIKTAATINGATGSIAFNEAGDRKSASYDFWAIRENDGVFTWERMAKYPLD